VCAEANDSVLLVQLDSSVVYRLDTVAADIWKAAVRFPTQDKVVEQLLREYEVDEQTLTADVIKLLDDLRRASLVG
jgi:hypothetical protein